MLALNEQKTERRLSVGLPPIVSLSAESKIKLPFWSLIDEVSASYNELPNNVKHSFMLKMQAVPFLFSFEEDIVDSKSISLSFAEIVYNNVLNEGKWLSLTLCVKDKSQEQFIEVKFSPFLAINVSFLSEIKKSFDMFLPEDYCVTYEFARIIAKFIVRFMDELYAQHPESKENDTQCFFYFIREIIAAACNENDLPLPFSTGFFEYVKLEKLLKMENEIMEL